MTEEQKLFNWMHWISGRLAGTPNCTAIPRTTEYPLVRSQDNTWVQQVKTWMASIVGDEGATQSGLAVFIGMPHTEGEAGTLGSIRTQIVTEISVAESRTYNANADTGFAPNGVGLHADDVAWAYQRRLQNWVAGSVAQAARCRDFKQNHEGWIPPDLRDGSEKFDLYVCAFQVHALFNVSVPTFCFPPIITITGTSAALTCTTAGAAFKYSLDGNYPTTDYTTAFTVASGQTVLAYATKSGLADSSLAETDVP